jgi:hypothetical protein
MKRLLIRLLGKKDACAILRLSLKHKLYCVYFCISFCTLCIGDETPLWAIALVVANFANAARLIKQVPLELEER